MGLAELDRLLAVASLADKVEHIFPRAPSPYYTPDNKWGFKMDVPTHEYNRGEVYNLCIGRGTLTAEDRFKINEHMVQTIRMLSELPFPKHLKAVPEYAGGHHETLLGTGYPRRLKKEDMSIPARIMAIADIFEALTAADRPYKKAKTLSESIKIMSFFKKDHHIDPGRHFSDHPGGRRRAILFLGRVRLLLQGHDGRGGIS